MAGPKVGYLTIQNFRYGLDARRSELTSQPGTLLRAIDCHINQGAEIEKRKAFVKVSLPANVFLGLAALNTQYAFGSIASPVMPNGFTYQQLTSPLGSAMTALVGATLYADEPFVVATFGTDGTFCFYAGVLVPDFYAGDVLTGATATSTQAANLVSLVNLTNNYTATLATPGSSTVIITGENAASYTGSTVLTTISGVINANPTSSAAAGNAGISPNASLKVSAGQNTITQSAAVGSPITLAGIGTGATGLVQVTHGGALVVSGSRLATIGRVIMLTNGINYPTTSLPFFTAASGSGAYGSCSFSGGGITAITIPTISGAHPGSGYYMTPILDGRSLPANYNADIILDFVGGVLSSILVNSTGSGQTDGVYICSLNNGTVPGHINIGVNPGSGASVTVTISGGIVTTAVIATAGSGYVDNPKVSFGTSYITSITLTSTDGLISAVISNLVWTGDIVSMASTIATAISSQGTGFLAEAIGNDVTISYKTPTTELNGGTITVVSGAGILIDACQIAFGGTSFTLGNSGTTAAIKDAAGTNITPISPSIAYTLGGGGFTLMSDLLIQMCYDINQNTGSSGYISTTDGSTLSIGRVNTGSGSGSIELSILVQSGIAAAAVVTNGGSYSAKIPNTLKGTLNSNVSGIGQPQSIHYGVFSSYQVTVSGLTPSITPVIVGGTPPYSIKWVVNAVSPAIAAVTPTNGTSSTTAFNMTASATESSVGAFSVSSITAHVYVEVTDNNGNLAQSNTCVVQGVVS